MAWSDAARQSSIQSRRAKKGSGASGALQGLMKRHSAGMPREIRQAMGRAISTIRAAGRGR